MKRIMSLVIAVLVAVIVIAGFLILPSSPPVPEPSKISPDSVGICVHSLSESDEKLVNDSGARWIRIDVSSDFGAAVENAKAYNLSVLGILDSWMMGNSTVFTLEEWRGNVTQYVSHYASWVDAWEIWNEPMNPSLNWTLLNLTIEQKPNIIIEQNMSRIVSFYFDMARAASPIIRQYDPSAKILLFGGLNLYSGDASNLELDKEFARQLAAKDIQKFGDAIAVHAYPWSGQVETKVWQSYTSSLVYYRGLFNQSLDVWITETGQNLTASGEFGQAQYLTEALNFFRGEVSHVFWYSLHDENSSKGDFGLIQDNGAPRSSYGQLQKAFNS